MARVRPDDPPTVDPGPVRRGPGLHLRRTAENVAEIDALAADLAADGGGRVGVEALLEDLPLRVRRSWAPHPRLLGRKVDRAFTWAAADRRDRRWWPQGISNSVGTGLAERHGHDVLAVSWYAKHGGGSRVSIVDLEKRRYAHVLLVTPTLEEGRPGLAPLKVHAGGILWNGDYLHIAGTGRGFFTVRMDDLMRVPAGSRFETFGHRYVLPVRFAHRGASDDGVERLRFSFLTLDRSTNPPHMVVGEYGRSTSRTRRLARFPTDPTTGMPVADADGLVVPEIDDRGESRMQGVAVVDGTYYVTASQGPFLPGTVHIGAPGFFRRLRWATPMGPEDLAHWPETDALWSVTEHPRRRWIFAMGRDGLRP